MESLYFVVNEGANELYKWGKSKLNNQVTNIKSSVRFIGNLEKKTEGFGLITKTTAVAISLLNIPFPDTAHLRNIKYITKELKEVLNLLKGARSLDYFVNGQPGPWYITALNIAGLTLFSTTILNFIEKFNLINLKPLTDLCAQVPLFGILPYAGIPKIAMITLFGCLIILGITQQRKLKITEQEDQTKLNGDPLDQKLKYKVQLNGEIKNLNTISTIQKVIHLGGIIFGTFLQLAKKESSSTAPLFLGLGIIEVGFTFANYLIKKKIKKMEKMLDTM